MSELKAGGPPVDDRRCFACGPDNPIGLRLLFERSGDGVAAHIVIAPAFQGWKGVAHGGIVMVLLDEAMAHAAAASGVRGVTAELSARFRAPVPIGEPLLVRGKIVWQRRTVYALEAAILHAGSQVELAAGSGRFVARGTIDPASLLAGADV